MNALEIRPERLWEDYWNEFDSLWENFWNLSTCECDPAVDIFEDKDRYLLRVELPGLTENDFKVEHERGILSISGKWPEPPKGETTVIRQERPTGEFCRRFNLPEDVDADRIEANYKNGLLELILPKKEEVKPKTVKIEVH